MTDIFFIGDNNMNFLTNYIWPEIFKATLTNTINVKHGRINIKLRKIIIING